MTGAAALETSGSVDDVTGGHALAGIGPCIELTSASPVVMPTRSSSPSSTANVADRERGPYGALRVVLVRHRRAEQRHHSVADELLHRAAVVFELRANARVVRAEDGLHVLRVHRLRLRREADEVAEQDRDDFALSARHRERVRRGRAVGSVGGTDQAGVGGAVKAAADMLDVVGGRTQLRKAGARYVGRCPFHEERTPSFSVNPVDKLFYCFGCGKGGDLISFVRETESLDFAGAIEWLGDRFRVPLEYEETSPAADAARKRRERLYRGARAVDGVLRALPVGDRGGRAGSGVSRGRGLERGDLPGVPARALADLARARAQGCREGIHAARAGCCRAREPAR